MTTAKEPESRDFQKVSAGTHQAVCYDVWDIGMQKVMFEGVLRDVKHKVILAWEANELIEEGEHQGERLTINKRYTLSLHEKASLKKDLEGWRGREFTLEERKGFIVETIIGVNCLLNVIHNKVGVNVYANITSIGKLMKGMTPLTAENVSCGGDRTKMPKWIQKLIENQATQEDMDLAKENKAKAKDKEEAEAEVAGTDPNDEAIPF